MSKFTSIYDQQGCERLRRRLRLDPVVVRRWRNGLFKDYLPDAVALAGLPPGDPLELHPLHLFRRCDSAIDGATKLLFRTRAGMLIESVILRLTTGRTTVCVSSQVGCAAACEFCATGKMGIARNLSFAEILDQIVQAGQLLAAEQRTPRNIVFMGMGEPFHNEDHLHQAIEILTAPTGFHFSPAKILVSTVGIADAMLRCVQRFPGVRLALSLHSVRQAVRERLIPVARRYPLDELQATIAEIHQRTGQPVMIEYLLLAGINDDAEDARELIAWLAGLNVHVNLIPFNPIDEAPQLTSSAPAQRMVFAALLKEAGLRTTMRYSLGSDISAACGQLVRHENRTSALQRE